MSPTTRPVPSLLTRPQAAEFLGVSVQTLMNWASSGKYGLPYVKLGGSVRYRLADLEDFIERRTVTHPGELSSRSA